MKSFPHAWQRSNTDFKRRGAIRTTLYEIIEAIGDELETGEESLIAAVILNLIESGRMKWARQG